MTIEESLQVIDRVCGAFVGNRLDHQRIAEAWMTLMKFVDKKKKKGTGNKMGGANPKGLS